MATETELKEEAIRVLRNVLEDITEVWRAYPDETYHYWEASLKHADFLFGLYEKSFDNVEDANTLDLSSAVNELVEALSELRQLEKDEDEDEDPEEWSQSVRTQTIGPFEEALSEVHFALNALSEDVK